MTTVRYSQLSQVRTYVVFVTQTLFDLMTSKLRLTKSGNVAESFDAT